MRNMCLGITAFVVTVGMVSAGAQGRNFSGTWVVDAEKTAAAAATEQAAGGIVARGGRGAGTAAPTASGGGGGAVAAGSGGRVIAGGGGGGAVMASGAGARGRVAASGEAPTGAAGTGGGGGGAVMARSAGGGGSAVVSSDMTITMDANTFTMDQGGFQTSYPVNGSENTIQLRSGMSAKARASWKGDMLVIEQTIDSPNGPVTSTTSWFLEGDSLVRLTARRTYFKKK